MKLHMLIIPAGIRGAVTFPLSDWVLCCTLDICLTSILATKPGKTINFVLPVVKGWKICLRQKKEGWAHEIHHSAIQHT
jgi:hypothetical protein